MAKKRKMVWFLVVAGLMGLLGWYCFCQSERSIFAGAFENPAMFHVYEGLPRDRKWHERVYQTSVTIQTAVDTAYAEPLAIKPKLEKELRQVVVDGIKSGGFKDSNLRVGCTFHLDYMLEAISRSGDRCQFLMCFTCSEARLYVNKKEIAVCYPNFSGFKQLLRGRVNQRPLALEWCEDLKFEIERGKDFKLYKGTARLPSAGEASAKPGVDREVMLIDKNEVHARPLEMDEVRLKAVKDLLMSGIKPLPQEEGEILYPSCLFHADYLLRWSHGGGRECYAAIGLGCGLVNFNDRGDEKMMMFLKNDEIGVLLGELKRGSGEETRPTKDAIKEKK